MKKKLKKIIAMAVILAISVSGFAANVNALGENSKSEKHGEYYTNGSLFCERERIYAYGSVTMSDSNGKNTGVFASGNENVTISISYEYYNIYTPKKIEYSGTGVSNYCSAMKIIDPPDHCRFSSVTAYYCFYLSQKVYFNLEA